MANFNRGNRGGNFRRGGFSGERSFDRPQMHQAVCDNCGKECQVPFKPTSGKPSYCSNCFEKNGGGESRRPQGRNFEERRMFDAVCSNCGNNCQLPFQPRDDKPVFCSNCFENRDKNINKGGNEQFEAINAKLDKILGILLPIVEQETAEEIEEVTPKKTKSPKKTDIPKE